jgi:hypothetical protein
MRRENAKVGEDTNSRRCGCALVSCSFRGTADISLGSAAISIGETPWSALGIADASLKAYLAKVLQKHTAGRWWAYEARSDTKAELSAGTIVAISSDVRPMLGKTNERKKRVSRTIPSSL